MAAEGGGEGERRRRRRRENRISQSKNRGRMDGCRMPDDAALIETKMRYYMAGYL